MRRILVIVAAGLALGGCVSFSVLGSDCQGWHLLRFGEPACAKGEAR